MAYATVDELAAKLRIAVTVGNTAGLQSCLDAAAQEINATLDLAPGTVTAGRYLFSTVLTSADPGPGYFRFDKTALPATKKMFVDYLDADGVDRSAGVLSSAADDLIQISDWGNANDWARFIVGGAAIDRGGWVEIPVNYDTGSGTLALGQAEPAQVAGLRPSVVLGQKLALAKEVNMLRAVEWWKSNDAAWNVLADTSGAGLRLPKNTFARHAATLLPLKQRFGIG